MELLTTTLDVLLPTSTWHGASNTTQWVSAGPIHRGKHYDCSVVKGLHAFEVRNKIGSSFVGAYDARDIVVANLTVAKDAAAKQKTQHWPEEQSQEQE